MLSRVYLIQTGKCCGLECLMCPYEKKHSGSSELIRKEVWKRVRQSHLQKTHKVL